jgi:hypothetical protein
MLTSTTAANVALIRATSPTSGPLLISIREARRQLGGIGTTAFYDAVKRHGIGLVRLGGRSLVPMIEIERVVAEIMASRSTDASIQAKALAVRSVEARKRSRRGDGASTPAPANRRRGTSTA